MENFNQFEHMHEVVNCEEIIGCVVDKHTGERSPTTWGVFHYGKDGIHIIPTTPRGDGENFWDRFKQHRPIDFFLSLQRALSSHGIPSLRAVMLQLDPIKEYACVSFFFDEPITAELFDLASSIFTESSADIVLPWTKYYFETIALSSPALCPITGHLVYHRYESNFHPPSQQEILAPFIHEKFYIRLVIQQALLGLVTPVLRGVFVDHQLAQRQAFIQFVYDGEITDFSRNLARDAVIRTKTFFPKNFEVIEKIQRIDFPNRYENIPLTENAWCVYSRKE